MKLSILYLMVLPVSLLLNSCAGSGEKLEIPQELPEICRGIDFVAQPDMREDCGVRPLRFQSYKNIPQQRYLINPKGASLVKSKDVVELRLPNMLPIKLSKEISEQVEFTQEMRMEYLKNTMDYKELFPPGQDRIKMFKLEIPTLSGKLYPLCFHLPTIPKDERKRTIMGQSIEPLDCTEFQMIVTKFSK